MKKAVFIFILLLLALNSNAQNNENRVKELMANIPKITADYESLEKSHIIFYFPSGGAARYKMPCKINNGDSINIHIQHFDGIPWYKEWDKNGYCTKNILWSPQIDEILTREHFANSLFYITKIFYSNGNLKEKGVASQLGFKIGLWYHYDEKGNVIKIEDNDKGYKFTTKDVLLFCLNNNITIKDNYISEYCEVLGWWFINKFTDENNPMWKITQRLRSKERIIIIDGKTGRVISDREEFVIDD